MSWKASILAVALAAAVCPTLSYAQNDPGTGNGGAGGNNGGGGGGGGGRRGQGGPGGQGGQPGGRMDPAQFQQQMMERVKEQLKVQDDEWRVIEPKLTKVMNAQRDARTGMGGMGFGGRRGGQGGQDQQPTTKLGIAQRDLRTALESDASSPEDIDKKLTAYRAARAEAQAQLDAARKDLKEVLTAKQEAQLVLMGTLE